ncbi:MAG: hypothetical protein QM831_22215 [Kofleriaceae bacterium]
MARSQRKTVSPPRDRAQTAQRGRSRPVIEHEQKSEVRRVEVNSRGRYSFTSAKGIPIDAVAGLTEGRTTNGARRGDVELISSTSNSLTIRYEGHTLTLDRRAARTLAALIEKIFV